MTKTDLKNHAKLLEEIQALKRKIAILETGIDIRDQEIVRLRFLAAGHNLNNNFHHNSNNNFQWRSEH